MKKLVFLFGVFVLLFNHLSKAAVGCKVPGGSTIYTSYTYYLLGVKLSGGSVIGVNSNVYHLAPSLSTNVSCSTSWVNSYSLVSSGNDCIYGSPAVAVPLVISLCNDCVWGDLVNYTTTIECNLDDYSWALGLGAGVFGVFVIKRRNKL